jgi:hypothetical protein
LNFYGLFFELVERGSSGLLLLTLYFVHLGKRLSLLANIVFKVSLNATV